MPESAKAVFLSYASQDAETARRICEALRALGITVWFDQSELRGGDAWDASIRKQIRECALFVPLISANSNSRSEGYFRMEWKLAVDRSHLIAEDQAFLLPVAIDDAPEGAARVPDRFRERQWLRLPPGESPAALAERVRLSMTRAGASDPSIVSPSAMSPSKGVAPPAADPSRDAAQFQIGEWRVDPMRNEMRRGDETLRLEPKAIEVLIHLARKPASVVPREELLSAVWPGVIVGDDALTQAIIKLRKALGDDAHRPKYIETISKRGYRLIAPVARAKEGIVAHGSKQPSESRRRPWVLGGAGVALTLLLAGSLLMPDLGKRLGLRYPLDAGEKAGPSAASIPFIAILPLSNLSGDAKRDYFSDGLTEDIINALSRYSSVRVISRNSVEAYKHRPADPQVVRKELGARYLLKGSVREADGKVRVAVELSDTEKNTVLWSDRHEGAGKDLFEIQDRIVRNIVGAVAVKVTRLEQQRAASRPPDDLEAYDLVLRARALLFDTGRVHNRQARALLAKAVEKAPNYGEAHLALAIAESQRATYGWVEDPVEGFLQAERHVRRALAADEASSHAHAVLANIYVTTHKYDQALAEADRAIELNPSDDYALDQRGGILLYLGRIDEAIAGIETAKRFNPAGRGAGSVFNHVIANYLARRYSEALAVADAGIARFPDAPYLHVMRAASLAQLGDLEGAQRAAAEVRRIDPFFPAAQFGNRFVDPKHMAHIQEGLRKAGL